MLLANDVAGDGSCFYRCIWRVCRESVYVAAALGVCNVSDEDVGVRELRRCVASALSSDERARRTLANLVDLYRDAPCLLQMYPILGEVRPDEGFDGNCERVKRAIAHTRVMASGLELEVIRSRLKTSGPILGVETLVLTYDPSMSPGRMSEKWLAEVRKMMGLVRSGLVIVLLNEDNVHYRYGTLFGRALMTSAALASHVNHVPSGTRVT